MADGDVPGGTGAGGNATGGDGDEAVSGRIVEVHYVGVDSDSG